MTFRHFLTGTLSLGFGLLFPAYGSFMAIESSGTEDDTQGATWMYEAIVGPTFQLILKEAVKIPSIDRLVNQTDLSGGQGVGSSQGAGLEQRIQQTLQGAGSALQQSLRNIQGAQDPTKKRRAEARFNKDLAKIDNISSHHSKAF
ncbi:MAG: hypothetical protein FRX49_05002 [Trebouxia sp. A1-2]|nr:MAG: hypothetical protein FRX49_05002 [Trebouxia sp. A1-2]